MGILINTTFTTAQGLPVTSVYGRVINMRCNVMSPDIVVTVEFETYLSREKRIEGFAPIFVPGVPTHISKTFPLDSVESWGSAQAMYSIVKEGLSDAGITSVVDVLVDPVPEPVAEPTA